MGTQLQQENSSKTKHKLQQNPRAKGAEPVVRRFAAKLDTPFAGPSARKLPPVAKPKDENERRRNPEKLPKDHKDEDDLQIEQEEGGKKDGKKKGGKKMGVKPRLGSLFPASNKPVITCPWYV